MVQIFPFLTDQEKDLCADSEAEALLENLLEDNISFPESAVYGKALTQAAGVFEIQKNRRNPADFHLPQNLLPSFFNRAIKCPSPSIR